MSFCGGTRQQHELRSVASEQTDSLMSSKSKSQSPPRQKQLPFCKEQFKNSILLMSHQRSITPEPQPKTQSRRLLTKKYDPVQKFKNFVLSQQQFHRSYVKTPN